MATNYEKSYSESGLWEKIEKFAKTAGKEIVTNVLKLYYAMALGKATPAQFAVIIGALGYFISPLDAIPRYDTWWICRRWRSHYRCGINPGLLYGPRSRCCG